MVAAPPSSSAAGPSASDERKREERDETRVTRLRGVEVPPGWSVVGGSLLVWSHGAPAPSARIAAFDFDDTLAKTALGGFDPSAWRNLRPQVPAVLRRLHDEGFRIVVVTNESMDRFKQPEAIRKAVAKKRADAASCRL